MSLLFTKYHSTMRGLQYRQTIDELTRALQLAPPFVYRPDCRLHYCREEPSNDT
jgi:hypothetical protein